MTLLDSPNEQHHSVRQRYRGVIIATAVLLTSVVALGVYAVQLKRRVEQAQTHVSESRPLPPPIAGPEQQIPLLVAYDEDGTLRRSTIAVPMPAERAERARQAIQTLLEFYEKGDSPHPLPPGSEIKNVFLVGDNLAVLNFNATFADQHRSGILVEELTIASISQTLAANVPGITQLKFLIDGKERDTLAGHADLRAVYDISAFRDLVRADGGSGDQGSN